jgi:hypothetical protein
MSIPVAVHRARKLALCRLPHSPLVNNNAPRLLELLDERPRVVSGSLDDLDTRLDDGGRVFLVRRGVDGGEDGEVL